MSIRYLDGYDLLEFTRAEVVRALFQAKRLMLQYWKSKQSPTRRELIHHMGNTLQLERDIFQHGGCPDKFEKL